MAVSKTEEDHSARVAVEEVETASGRGWRERDCIEGSMPPISWSEQQQSAAMPEETTTAQFGVMKGRNHKNQRKHPENPPTNSGEALTDASGAKSLRMKRRKWTELSMAMAGGGTASGAGGGSKGR